MKYEQITDQILNAFYKTYNNLGYGFCEKAYENALMIELKNNGLTAKSQYPIKVHYRGFVIGDFYADILVNDKILLELKAVKDICSEHKYQLLRYLNASVFELGLVLNFGEKPKHDRVIYSNDQKQYKKSNQIFKSLNNTEDTESRIINSFYNCYNSLGYGFLDKIYKDAMRIEFQQNNINFDDSKHLDIYYGSKILGQFQPHFMINNIMVLITNRPAVRQVEKNLLCNLLKSTKSKSGILLNFGNCPEFIKNSLTRR